MRVKVLLSNSIIIPRRETSGEAPDSLKDSKGNVWCTGKYLYQATDIVGSLITDINLMLTGETDGMTFIYKLN